MGSIFENSLKARGNYTLECSEKVKFVLGIRNSAKNLSFGWKRRFVKSERFLLMFRPAPRELK